MRGAVFAIGALLVFSASCRGPDDPPPVQALKGVFTGANDSVGLSLNLTQDGRSITGTGTVVVGIYSWGVSASGSFELGDSAFTLALSGGSSTAVYTGDARNGLRGVLSGVGGPGSYSVFLHKYVTWSTDARLTFTEETLTVRSGSSFYLGAGDGDLLVCENCWGQLGGIVPVTLRGRNPTIAQKLGACSEYSFGFYCEYSVWAPGPHGSTWLVATAGGIGTPTDSAVVSVITGYAASVDFVVQPTTVRVNFVMDPPARLALRDRGGRRTYQTTGACRRQLALLPGGVVLTSSTLESSADTAFYFVNVRVPTAGTYRFEARTVQVDNTTPCRNADTGTAIAWDTSATFTVTP